MGAAAHTRNCGLLPVVRGIEGVRGGLIVVDGTKPVALRGQDIAADEGGITALMADIGRRFPFAVPVILILRVDPTCREQAFGNGRAAFLGGPQ